MTFKHANSKAMQILKMEYHIPFNVLYIPEQLCIYKKSSFTLDAFYNDMRAQSEDLIKCINVEVRALADAGCKYIQIDEPVLVRLPEVAMDFGIDHLARCFEVGVCFFVVMLMIGDKGRQ